MKNPSQVPKQRARYQDLGLHDRQRIVELFRMQYGTRKIAKRMGTSRKVVRRILAEQGLTNACEKKRARKIDPFLEVISRKVQAGLTTSRILREIKELGYTGGRTMLAEYAGSLRTKLDIQSRRPSAKRRFETDPAVEMQIDWSPGWAEIAKSKTRIHVLGMIMAHSRKLFIGIYRNEKESTLLEGLAHGFDYFDGCPIRCVFDNMSTVVLGRSGGKPIWHPRFLDFVRHYGFQPHLCAVADPDRKGKIEKSFRLVFDDFLKGSSFSSWEDLTRRARIWLDETPGAGNLRIHGTTGLVPNEVFLVEKDLLITLPRNPFPVYDESVRAVDRDATISVQGQRYTVPVTLANRQVTVRLFAEHFEVFNSRGRMVFSRRYVDPATHVGNLVIDPTHYAHLPPRSELGHGRKRLDQAFVSRFPELEPLIDGIKTAMKGLTPIHIQHLLRLVNEYGQEPFLDAARKAQTNQRFSSHAVKRILEKDHPLPPENHQTPLGGLGAALLGEVEEADLGEFAHLDREETPDENK